jgi:hypothetical protein
MEQAVLKLSASMVSTGVLRKIAPNVLFLRVKHSRSSPSHSTKLMGGGGTRGSMRTTLLSTLGGGRKLFFDTFITCEQRASSCELADSRQYSSSVGRATRRMANSRCTISMAHRKKGR